MRESRKISILVVCAAAVGLGAYGIAESRRTASALPVSVRFAVDKEGKSVTIPFDVREGEMDMKRRLMIALDVPNGPDLPAVKDVVHNSRTMRVRVFYEQQGVRTPVETEDDDTIIARNTGKPLPHSDMSACRLDLYGTLDDEFHIAVCGFFAKRYGHYVAEISTVEPLPAFEAIGTRVRVDQFYNTGK
jgi:hypothetical protein